MRTPTLVVLALFVLVGCFERSLRPVEPCTRSNVREDIQVTSVDAVDLLFVIDDSGSMAEEQTSLIEELPRIVRILASGDRDEDGVSDFEPVRSLQIGVVTTDMGSGGFTVPTCASGTFGTELGDDGVLLTRGRTSMAGCTATYPSIFEFTRGGDAMAFGDDVGCVAAAGIGGCGFEQQLEATLKALSPSVPTEWTAPGYVPPVFFRDTRGHADRENVGFIRPDSALAIILVTDEEDCSVADPSVFDPASPTYGTTDLNLRCFAYPDVAHRVARYVRGEDGHSGLIGLRQNPGLLLFAGIVGVPLDFDFDAGDTLPPDQIDPSMPTRLLPSCNVPGRGIAFAPPRIVETARGIRAAGGSATIQSICQASFAPALDNILDLLIDQLGGACLPRQLNADASGFVDCQVLEVLPSPAMHCEDLPGRIAAGQAEVGGVMREQCEVLQVGPGSTSPGWFYETAADAPPMSDIHAHCPGGQRIRFSGADPATNAVIRLECLQTVRSSSGGTSIGSFCDPTADLCTGGMAPDGATVLACDAADRTCAVGCGDSSDCTRAGLVGQVCDTRSWLDAVGANEPGISDIERARRIGAIPAGVDPASAHAFCVNSTCI